MELSPALNPPQKLVIGASKYDVSYDINKMNEQQVKEGCFLYGILDLFTQQMIIYPDMGHDRTCEIVWHESLHGMVHNCLRDLDEVTEEKVCAVLAPAILDFMRRNKDFMQFCLSEY